MIVKLVSEGPSGRGWSFQGRRGDGDDGPSKVFATQWGFTVIISECLGALYTHCSTKRRESRVHVVINRRSLSLSSLSGTDYSISAERERVRGSLSLSLERERVPRWCTHCTARRESRVCRHQPSLCLTLRVFAAVVSRQSIGWHMSARTLPADYERTTSTPVVVRNSSPKVNDWGSVRLMTD